MIKRVKGFKDILHEEAKLREKLLIKAKNFFELNGFKELITPILEKTELFLRSIGEVTDIVQKEMFTFQDKNGESLTLRPEGTASIVRAYIENNLYAYGNIHKFYYYGPMFRRERPQKGRLRQFYQIGIECFGSESPLLDAHVIFILYHLLNELKVKDISIEINSVGCEKCRPCYEENLINYLKKYSKELCSDCNVRIEKNPLRVLDCKNVKCKEIVKQSPNIINFLCNECKEHFDMVKNFLAMFEIPFIENRFMVRGLDYYTRTVFEAISYSLGGQNAIGAGGRYDSLVYNIGGKNVPGIGFAVGLERILLVTEEAIKLDFPEVYLIIIGESTYKKGLEIYKKLVNKNIKVEFDYEMKGLKNQLKKADKINARYAIIIGEEELKEEKLILRDLKLSTQEKISEKELLKKLRG